MDPSWKLKRVRIGEWNTESERDCDENDSTFCSLPPIDNVIVAQETHRDYRPESRSQFHDIALLRLAKKIKFNDFVQPICLPLDPELWTKNFTGYTFDVAGMLRENEFCEHKNHFFFLVSGWGKEISIMHWFSHLGQNSRVQNCIKCFVVEVFWWHVEFF